MHLTSRSPHAQGGQIPPLLDFSTLLPGSRSLLDFQSLKALPFRVSSFRAEDTLKGNAFKDSVLVSRFLIPAGIVEISRGSRSDSDDHPRI